MKLVQATLIACVGTLAISSAASATSTVATFADPAANPSTPLFNFNAGTGVLTGSWLAQPGLTLQTPGLPAADFSNAQFTMTPVGAINSFGNIYVMGGGQINFFDSANAPLLTITFASSIMTSEIGFGASDFTGQGVTFSGPILAPFTVISQESFSFSFANPAHAANAPVGSFTVTSAFTSSADVQLPAPGAAALLGLGGLVAVRRRR